MHVKLWNDIAKTHREIKGADSVCVVVLVPQSHITVTSEWARWRLQPQYCLFNRLLRLRSKKTSTICITGLCAGNSPVTGEFPTQKASNAEKLLFDDVIMNRGTLFLSDAAACDWHPLHDMKRFAPPALLLSRKFSPPSSTYTEKQSVKPRHRSLSSHSARNPRPPASRGYRLVSSCNDP